MDNDLVYSTTQGDLRKKANKKSSKNASLPPGVKNDGTIRVQKEKKGRGGKTVTVLYGVPLEGNDLVQLSKQMKQHIGTGGTLKDGVIVLQGDHIPKVITFLKNKGFQTKRMGG